MATTLLSRVPLLALICALIVSLGMSTLDAAEKKPAPAKPEPAKPTGPLPTVKNSNWAVAWRDAEGATMKGRLSFSSDKVGSSELGLGDVTFTDTGAWSGSKTFKAKISFKGTGKDKTGSPLTISGEVNDKNLTATVTIKAKDGEKKLLLSGSR